MRHSFHCVLMTVALATPALAKLPPLNDEAKAKAAETAAKAAWADKVGLYKHCLVTDRIASAYRKTGTAATTPVAATPVAVATTTSGPVPASMSAPVSAPVTTVAAVSVPVVIPPCADPGPFAMPVVTPVAAKPLEAAGAHSPAGTAVSPPSAKATAAELSADPKASPVTPVKDKPLEAAEAHSPPGTAVGPPSTNATNAELTGKSKK